MSTPSSSLAHNCVGHPQLYGSERSPRRECSAYVRGEVDMADGNTSPAFNAEATCGARLVARCGAPGCGASTLLWFDNATWGWLRGASIYRLEDLLRCTCGARTGTFESWSPQHAPQGGNWLYLFNGYHAHH